MEATKTMEENADMPLPHPLIAQLKIIPDACGTFTQPALIVLA
jgi:hypothetical protein